MARHGGSCRCSGDFVQVARTPARLNPLANVAAISLRRSEAPERIAGSQFSLFKMLTDLINSDLAPACILMWPTRAVVTSRAAWASGYC
jgi:hypothetical protein